MDSSLRAATRLLASEPCGARVACGSQTLVELASGKRFIGTERLEFFGALHTWGRDFTVYNPHVHFVVPGGGVSDDGSAWLPAPENFLLPVRAASKVYPGKFRDAIRDARLASQFEQADREAWPVGNGQAVLKYLAPYVNRVAISIQLPISIRVERKFAKSSFLIDHKPLSPQPQRTFMLRAEKTQVQNQTREERKQSSTGPLEQWV